MQLHLFHGRTKPDEYLQDWGFDGPTINEITSLTGAYGELFAHFENEQHLYKAQKQTGWDLFGDFWIDCEVSRGSANSKQLMGSLGIGS